MDQKETKEKIIMNATLREITGKHTRSLRKNGIVPANIYGKGYTPQTISLDKKEFIDTFKAAGETNVVYVKVYGKEIPTLFSEIQIHPTNQSVLHVDLKKIDLKKKVETQVPFVISSLSEAVEKKHGILLTQMTEVTIEALPSDIPNNIAVDISNMSEIGDVIRISDLPKSTSYEIKEEPDRIIVSITEHKEEELVPETVSEEPEITGEVVGDGESSEDTTDQNTSLSGENKKE